MKKLIKNDLMLEPCDVILVMEALNTLLAYENMRICRLKLSDISGEPSILESISKHEIKMAKYKQLEEKLKTKIEDENE